VCQYGRALRYRRAGASGICAPARAGGCEGCLPISVNMLEPLSGSFHHIETDKARPMKISGVDIRPGNNIEYEGGLWRAVKIQHTQPGKGGAYMQVELKNLID